MITDYDAFIGHLKRTGRMKLLPAVLRELRQEAIRERKRAPRTETAEENPSLLSGSRTIGNGLLTDTTGKRALLDIYQKIVSSR